VGEIIRSGGGREGKFRVKSFQFLESECPVGFNKLIREVRGGGRACVETRDQESKKLQRIGSHLEKGEKAPTTW